MTKVIIKEKYKTSFGNVIQIEKSAGVKVGDNVQGDDGVVYKIKRIIMPTRPGNDTVGLIYE